MRFPGSFKISPKWAYLILKCATHPLDPHAPQLAELLCQSGECLGNNRAHSSFTYTHGEMSICSSESQRGHFIFHSSATLKVHPFRINKTTRLPQVPNRQRFWYFLPEPTMLRRGTKDGANIFFQCYVELHDYVIRGVS